MRQSLETINSFVEAYGLFTEMPDLNNQGKVFEAILYAFTSTFIWKMRDDYCTDEGRESARATFPCFLIIGGRSSSGKTTTLEFISMLLGNHGKRCFSYNNIHNSIDQLFSVDNLFPILVDEISVSFFKSQARKKGENLIKWVANEREGMHPVFIGTTNATDFHATDQILRRIYYLQIDKVFDKARQAESAAHLGRVQGASNDLLFKDFTHRMGQFIKNQVRIYKADDPLYIARQIFRDYYSEANMELPAWFPQQPFNDYDTRGRLLWHNTYNTYAHHFKEQTDGTLFVEINEFCGQPKNREVYCNYLPSGCIVEDGVILVINKVKFLEFIGWADNNRSLFKRVKRYLGIG